MKTLATAIVALLITAVIAHAETMTLEQAKLRIRVLEAKNKRLRAKVDKAKVIIRKLLAKNGSSRSTNATPTQNRRSTTQTNNHQPTATVDYAKQNAIRKLKYLKTDLRNYKKRLNAAESDVRAAKKRWHKSHPGIRKIPPNDLASIRSRCNATNYENKIKETNKLIIKYQRQLNK